MGGGKKGRLDEEFGRCIDIEAIGPHDGVDVLALETFVFMCWRNPCASNHSPWGHEFTNPLFGLDGVVIHQRQSRNPAGYGFLVEDAPTIIEVSPKGCAVTAELVALVGLGSSVLLLELWTRILQRGVGRVAYFWRAAVAHSTANHGHVAEPPWVLLKEAAKASVRLETDAIKDNAYWSCSHHTIRFEDWKNKQTVEEHLKTMHNITNPELLRDLFFFSGKRRCVVRLAFFEMPQPQV
ncbi:hypothetical protein Hypma_012170 [Hypsizygus marmoreus]|uniref:Uncharacterized protein n=1 Tax=Hypsizygus marmoreus TaxID=39966 RepID=A0A369JK21_HYPMA|nr:hypothetical protein Hypma_012170 [Hypsizygus marmoreus]